MRVEPAQFEGRLLRCGVASNGLCANASRSARAETARADVEWDVGRHVHLDASCTHIGGRALSPTLVDSTLVLHRRALLRRAPPY